MKEMIQKKMQESKKSDKGFSLVELIIVIAIMAILVGIVGTQVIPYLNKSKQAKDQQVLNSFCTAAVSAYSMNAEEIDTDSDIVVYAFGDMGEDSTEGMLADAIAELTGYDAIDDASLVSNEGKDAKDVYIEYDFDGKTVTVYFVDTVGSGSDVGISSVTSNL